MEQEAIIIKSLTTEKDRNGTPYLQITDGFGNRWNLFNQLAKTKFDTTKGYLIKYEPDGQYKKVMSVELLSNHFKLEALRELANRNDITKNYFMSLSYAKDLVVAGKIDLANIYNEAQHIYDFINARANDEMAKLGDK